MKRFRIAPFYRPVIALWLLILIVTTMPRWVIYSQPDQATCLSGIDDTNNVQNIVDTRSGGAKSFSLISPSLDEKLRNNPIGYLVQRNKNKLAYLLVTDQQMQVSVIFADTRNTISTTIDRWPSLSSEILSLSWSADERYVLLFTASNIGIFDVATAQFRNIPLSALALTEGEVSKINWSPAGHLLLHLVEGTKTEATNSKLVAYDLDTQTTRSLATNVAYYRLSPDLKHILIVRPLTTDEDHYDYVIIDVDSGTETPLLVRVNDLNPFERGWLDNQTLLLNLSPNLVPTKGDLVWTKVDGSQMRKYPQDGALTISSQSPLWTVYIANNTSTEPVLLVDNKTGTVRTYSVDFDAIYFNATVSPDSKWISVQGYKTHDNQFSGIQLVSVETGKANTFFAPNGANSIRAIWSPDSQSVAFITRNEAGSIVHLLRPDASEIKQLQFPDVDLQSIDQWSNCAPYQ